MLNSGASCEYITKVVTLLGRRDQPTDGVEDFSVLLGKAFEARRISCEIARVFWQEQSWIVALRRFGRLSKAWRGLPVLVQYTALGWSRRGFPFGFLAVLRTLRSNGARIVIVFHDVAPFAATGVWARLRCFCQQRIIRTAFRWATRSVFPVPLTEIPWLPRSTNKAAFIPIGANIPPINFPRTVSDRNGNARTVAIFGVTGSGEGPREISQIVHAAAQMKKQIDSLRLIVLGRGSEESRATFERALRETGVEVSVLGVLPPEEISKHLALADVLLCVRGEITPRRGSAIAGIACGLPVIGYGRPECCFPVSEAGVELVPLGDTDALEKALENVLSDPARWSELHERSRMAQDKYFSWDKIAESYLRLLSDE
ncbi:MAG: glycosyltransferase family 4 protein [Candidatus Acidiferrales bacterium]